MKTRMSWPHCSVIVSVCAASFAPPAFADPPVTQELPAQPIALAPDKPSGETTDKTLERDFSTIMNIQGGLTAEAVAQRAQTTSFDIAAKHADTEDAKGTLDKAVIGFFPKLSGSATYNRLSEFTSPFAGLPAIDGFSFSALFPFYWNNGSFQATLTIPVSDYFLRFVQNYSGASHTVAAAELNERAAKLKVRADAKLSYYSWARAQLQRMVAEQALSQAVGHAKDVKDTFEAGSASKADVLRVDSQVASAEQLVSQAKNLVIVTEQQLRTVIHDNETASFGIGENLLADPSRVDWAGDMKALYAEALNKRLEIRALDETELSLKDEASVNRAGYFPRLDVSAQGLVKNQNERLFIPKNEWFPSWSVGAQINWTVNDTANAAASNRSLTSKAESIHAQTNALRDQLRLEVAQSWQALRDAESAIDTTARGLAAAEESYRVRRELFRNGRATSIELTDAETDLTNSRFDAINARIDARIGLVRLEHSVGRDIPKG